MLNNLGLSSVKMCTVLPYFAGEQGCSQKQPRFRFDFGQRYFARCLAASYPSLCIAAANPSRPIELTAQKPAEKMKEITDRLEQGIQDLFESDRFKEYLQVMSKFHNYSFNNTLLIAMQKPDATLVAGYNSWKNLFGRQVSRGAKGIKVLAPSPYKIKKEVDKIDPKTQKPVTDKNGKTVKEEMEITVPAFKIVSVFDVSQTPSCTT